MLENDHQSVKTLQVQKSDPIQLMQESTENTTMLTALPSNMLASPPTNMLPPSKAPVSMAHPASMAAPMSMAQHNMMAPPTQTSQANLYEHQKISEIKYKAASMKGTLALNGRCPKCTLKPPCKHFQSLEELNNSVSVTDQKSNAKPTSLIDAKREGTPDRGLFYPEHSIVSGGGISMTTDSNAT